MTSELRAIVLQIRTVIETFVKIYGLNGYRMKADMNNPR